MTIVIENHLYYKNNDNCKKCTPYVENHCNNLQCIQKLNKKLKKKMKTSNLKWSDGTMKNIKTLQ